MSLDSVSTQDLIFMAGLLERIITSCADDPRVSEPRRQLAVILEEIKKRKENTMADYNSMTAEELESVRAKMQQQIEEMNARMVEAGKALERKRFEQEVLVKLEGLEKQKAELESSIEHTNQVVGLKTLPLRAAFGKLFGGR